MVTSPIRPTIYTIHFFIISTTDNKVMANAAARKLQAQESPRLLFCFMNSCVQYEAGDLSASFGLCVPLFDCLCKPYTLT